MAQMVARLNALEIEEFTPAPADTASAANSKLQDAGASLGAALGKSVAKVRNFGQQTRGRAEFIKQEKPLQLLGTLAGIAMAAGFAARVWRSTRNA